MCALVGMDVDFSWLEVPCKKSVYTDTHTHTHPYMHRHMNTYIHTHLDHRTYPCSSPQTLAPGLYVSVYVCMCVCVGCHFVVVYIFVHFRFPFPQFYCFYWESTFFVVVVVCWFVCLFVVFLSLSFVFFCFVSVLLRSPVCRKERSFFSGGSLAPPLPLLCRGREEGKKRYREAAFLPSLPPEKQKTATTNTNQAEGGVLIYLAR